MRLINLYNPPKFCNSIEVQLVDRAYFYLSPTSFDQLLFVGVQNPVPPRKTTCTAANLERARA